MLLYIVSTELSILGGCPLLISVSLRPKIIRRGYKVVLISSWRCEKRDRLSALSLIGWGPMIGPASGPASAWGGLITLGILFVCCCVGLCGGRCVVWLRYLYSSCFP